jgi:protoporphyrinogen oxidase
MTSRVPILILGAGPTGLGAAWRLTELGERGWRLVEATDYPGGLATSFLDEHGFTWDVGCHVQHGHYDYFETLMDDLLGPDGWYRHDRESWVWLRDRFVPYPFQFNVHRLPDGDMWQCVRGLIHAALNPSPRPTSFGDWIDATFGPGIGHVFLRPYNEKIWAHPLSEMQWRWIGDRVALVDLPRVVENVRLHRDDVSWGPNSQFRFPKTGGTGAVWRALYQRLQSAGLGRLELGRSVTHVDTASRTAHFADGETVQYDHLISTMPLDLFVRRSDLRGSLGEVARSLKYSSTHIVGIALNGQAPASLHGKSWIYYPESNCPFYRLTHFSHYSPANVADSTRQWSLMAEIAESAHRPIPPQGVERATVDGLIATKTIRDASEVHHLWHRRFERGYPVPSMERDAVLDRVMPVLESRGVLSRGRFGAWKYEVANQDHSLAQGVEAVDRIVRGTEEETLAHPEIVNARRPAPRVVNAT